MTKQRRVIDKRLLGTWQSDRRKTFQHFKPKAGTSPAAFRQFKAIFGKLTLTWDRRQVHTQFDGMEETSPYEVVAIDSRSVVIRTFNTIFDEPLLHHIHFEEKWYWMAISGNIVEWFRRIDDGS